MRINLSKLKEPGTFSYSMKDAWVRALSKELAVGEPTRLINPFEMQLSISKPTGMGNSYLIRTKFKASIKTPCSRCLTDFIYPLTEEVVFTAINSDIPTYPDSSDIDSPYSRFSVEPGPDSEEDTRDESTILLSNNYLILEDLVTETIFLNFPFAPVCKPDCRGLCPHCGIDHNTEKCCCTEAAMLHNQLQGLRHLHSSGG